MNKPSLLGKLANVFWRNPPLFFRRRGARMFLPDDQDMTERWDRDWIIYLNTEDPRPFLLPHTSLTLVGDLGRLSAEEVHEARLTAQLPPLRIFMPGSRLIGGRIIEIGCGPGLLCKQMGLVASRVVGIDHSALALHIARLVSPPNCSYWHSSRKHELQPLHGTFDCMVCRFFFIHQNWESSIEVLGLAHHLLRVGGMVGADFLMPEPGQKQGLVYPARHALSRRYPSCGFLYTMQEIEKLADTTGFRVVQTWENHAHQRRFALLARQ
jgi:SAM-dependent methyltransferase